MKRLHVNIPGHEYDICIGNGVLGNLCELINLKGKTAAIITDSNVFPLYGKKLNEILDKGGAKTHTVIVPAGEQSKSSACLETVYTDLLDLNITRSDFIIALGGGVVGDLAGYAAATLLRGIPFIQIPTTLLAQVDSSVGGKVAINHVKGKNLIGAFYQPKLVLADTDCLKSLDKRYLNDGMGEVIKYGAIEDAILFEALEQNRVDMNEIVLRCCDIKRRIVECDEHDMGLRMILNFGHTFGHAIERFYNFEKYSHGEAVSIGMVLASVFGERMGVTKEGTASRLEKLLIQSGLPTQFDQDLHLLIQSMLSDKKRDGNTINLILLNEIGSCKIHKLEMSKLEELL